MLSAEQEYDVFVVLWSIDNCGNRKYGEGRILCSIGRKIAVEYKEDDAEDEVTYSYPIDGARTRVVGFPECKNWMT